MTDRLLRVHREERTLLKAMLLILAVALPLSGRANEVGAVNEARLNCNARSGNLFRLRESSRLNDAARRLAVGEDLQNATRNAGYRSLTSAALQITNVPADRDVTRIVSKQFCSQVTAQALRDIGTYRRGPDVWLLVAAPFTPPGPRDREAIARQVLELTNRARAHARLCGIKPFPAAPPLAPAPASLERAAMEHSQDMARYDYMDHIGRNGTSPSDRVTRAGYKWRSIGENLASGIITPEEVVSGWMGSPHHCENLMAAQFTQMAVAYAVNPSSKGGIYWTQLFGTPP